MKTHVPAALIIALLLPSVYSEARTAEERLSYTIRIHPEIEIRRRADEKLPPYRWYPYQRDVQRAEEVDSVIFRNRRYYNYELFRENIGEPSLPVVTTADFLMEPHAGAELKLHHDLLEAMFSENMRRVFFVVDVSPYFPAGRHDPLPWRRRRDHYYFGNAFWENNNRIRDVFRLAYGTTAPDSGTQLRRVEKYNEAEAKPQAVVFAVLMRSGSHTSWKNAWGWNRHYYFLGRAIVLLDG